MYLPPEQTEAPLPIPSSPQLLHWRYQWQLRRALRGERLHRVNTLVDALNLVSLRENIDTSSATGRAFIAIMGTINQMERELRAERTAAGRAAARARGRTGGRPRTSIEKLEQARILYDNGGGSATVVCKTFGIGRRTFFNHLAAVRQAAIATQREGAANPSGETGTD